MKTYVVGDIHGCFDELMELVNLINLKDEDLLISLGDIVDRGNKSKEVYEFFKNRPKSIVLMGNHERKHQKKILNYAQEIVKLQFGKDYNEFLNWIDTLPYFYETNEAIIVHAFFEHDKSILNQKNDVLCGSTSGERYLQSKYPIDKFWNEFYLENKPIIYGHHVVGNNPIIVNKTFGIDTGACHGCYLTGIELNSFEIYQIKSKKDYWKEEQLIWQIPVLKSKNWIEMSFSDIDKQLDKLSYIENCEIVNFIESIKKWKIEIQNSIEDIYIQIVKLTNDILDKKKDFNSEVSKFNFKNYLYKSKSNNLKLEDLEKGLNTPFKVIEITKSLKDFKI